MCVVVRSIGLGGSWVVGVVVVFVKNVGGLRPREWFDEVGGNGGWFLLRLTWAR